MKYAPVAFAALVAGCYSGAAAAPSTADDGGIDDAAIEADAAVDASELAPKGNTWSWVYGAYFAGTSTADTPGHCGKQGCHMNLFHGFKCGADKDTCYAGLVNVGLVNPAHPEQSSIVAATSVVVWLDPVDGIMPQDNRAPNDQAAADIRAWVRAGGKNDGADAGDASASDAGASDVAMVTDAGDGGDARTD